MNAKANKASLNNESVANLSVLCEEPNPKWHAFRPHHARRRSSFVAQNEKDIKNLSDYLLSIGGESVEAADEWDGDFCRQLLKQRWRFPTNAIIERGRKDWCCYHNCRNLWQNTKEKYRAVIGFALNEGMWFLHLWLINSSNHVVDATPQENYVGMIFSDEEAEYVLEKNNVDCDDCQ